jgi:hypothetical protein
MNPIITTREREATYEEEWCMAKAVGAVLRRGVTSEGEVILFWDMPAEGRYALDS